MYIKFSSSHPKFSYVIVKNPNSPAYTRDLSTSEEGTRTVTGSFSLGSEKEYQILVNNDERKMTEILKEQNRPFYVSSKPYAVNPYNLSCVTHALRTAINGTVKPTGLTEEEFYAPHEFTATVGPFTAPREVLLRLFQGVGFDVVVKSEQDYAFEVILHAGGSNERALTGNLQRILIVSYAVSIRREEGMLDRSQLDALAEKSKTWLASVNTSVREDILKRLASYRKDQVATFDAKLERDEDDTAPTPVKPIDESLHTMRHKAIIGAWPESARTVVDLGCGDGKFLHLLVSERDQLDITAIDSDAKSIMKLRRKLSGKVRTWHTNILAPYLETSDLAPDALILSEVIEHLEATDRRLLIDQIARLWQPEHLFLTTPNVTYNAILGIEGYRHKDHRIEYTRAQLQDEVIVPLQHKYELTVLPLLGIEEEPSFVVYGHRKGAPSPDLRMLYNMREKHAAISLEEVGAFIGTKELRDGMTHDAYLGRRNEIFYLSPTMAPADYHPAHEDTLEHPEGAFTYFRNRGITHVVEEEKHMGSRGHILYFRTPDLAKEMGFKSQVVSVSRNGYEMLEPADNERFVQDLENANWNNYDEVRLDWIALDCEVMPWSYKAGGTRHNSLIKNSFGCPGAAAILDKRAKGESVENVEKFMTALSWFSEEGEVYLNAFGLLAAGKISTNQKTHSTEYKIVHWGIDMPHGLQIANIIRFANEMQTLKHTSFRVVDLNSVESKDASIARWEAYTSSGKGEGFCYKPVDPTSTLSDGSRVQHSIKVRGRDYLRLIYGFNYLEQLEMFKWRGTGKKRYAALKEELVGRKILRSFFAGMTREHEHYLAGFLGMETYGIDATL